MFGTVLLMLFLLQLNNAVDFTLSARDGHQNLTTFVGDVPIILNVYDIREDIRGGDCSGTCTINKRTTILTTCNFIDIPGSRHLHILIQNRAEKMFSGSWQCNYPTGGLTLADQPLEYFNFNMVVKEIDLISIPAGLLLGDVQFNITSPDVVNNFTLEEGNQTVVMFITLEQFRNEQCNGWCEMNKKEKITTSSCSTQKLEQSSILQLILNPLKVTKSHAGSWKCYYIFPSINGGPPLTFEKMNIAVHTSDDSADVWWLYVAIAAGVLVILAIIIGQTICIIYFKSKAKKAEINKNLTPNKNTDDSPDVRYVKKTTSNGEVRESVLYEALETVRGGAPIPPPIETLPVTPKPGRMSRSFSHNNLSRDEHMTMTSPWMPKKQKNQGKFNTVDRMRNRPPMPTPDEIYEVMAPGDAPEPAKGWFKTKTLEQSPLLEKQKKTLFGQSQPLPPDPRIPASPKVSRKPAVPLSGPSRLQAGPGPMGPGPVLASGRPPVGGTAIMGAMPMLPSMITAANLRPVKPRPFEPPSEGYRMPPPPENPRTRAFRTQDTPRPEMQDHPRTNAFQPQDSPRMPVMQDHSRMPNAFWPQNTQRMPFRLPVRFPQPSVEESPRMLGSGFRMPVRNDQPVLPKPSPVPFTKPKPPVPLPEPEPIEPEYEPESYYGSSDEEFDCYDVLPEYRIYGNAPPKKIQ